MHIVDEPRKFSPSNVLTYTVYWTIFSSMTSDISSAPKRCTKLMKDYQDFDREKFGQAGPEALDIVENFVPCIYVSCNLRKVFLSETKLVSSNGTREYHSVDVFIHEFYKLFGRTVYQNTHMVLQSALLSQAKEMHADNVS